MRGSLARLTHLALRQQPYGLPAWGCTISSQRSFCSPPESPPEQDVSSIGNEKVRSLADSILELTVLEASWLSEILRKRLNMQTPAFGAMPMAMGMPGMVAAPAAAADSGAAAAPAEEKKEKTEFNVKLDSYAAEAKIKVIKEIRAITNLGLKEAKELVEKAPVVIKSAVAKADADTLQKQLEAVGAKVVLE